MGLTEVWRPHYDPSQNIGFSSGARRSYFTRHRADAQRKASLHDARDDGSTVVSTRVTQPKSMVKDVAESARDDGSTVLFTRMAQPKPMVKDVAESARSKHTTGVHEISGQDYKDSKTEDTARMTASAVNDVLRKKMAGKPDLLGSSVLRRKPDGPNMSSAQYFVDELMDLVPTDHRPSTPEALYLGTSHDDKGRRDYLKRRARMPVQSRYAFPVTANMEYGFVDPVPQPHATTFRRKNTVQKSFFRAQGAVTYLNIPGT